MMAARRGGRSDRTTRGKHMTRTRVVGGLLALGLVLGACGSGGGEADKTPQQILDDAVAAMKSAKTFHISGTMTDSTGTTTVALDVGTGSAEGTFSQQGLTAKIVVTGGKFYLQGKELFSKFAGPQAGALIGDRWVIIPTSVLSGVDAFTDVQKFASCLASDHGTLSKGGTGSVDGQAAVILVDKGDKPGTQAGKLYVAASGTAYVLRLEDTGKATAGGSSSSSQCGGSADSASTGTLTLSRFNQTVSVTPPPDALDLSKLGG
jgi:hypothetical protein